MVPGKPGGFAPPILFLLEKKNASRPVEEKDALGGGISNFV